MKMFFTKHSSLFVSSGFRRGVIEYFALLGHNAAEISSNRSFWDILSVPSSSVKLNCQRRRGMLESWGWDW